MMARRGTPLAVVCANAFGAWPCSARLYSMRPVLKMPLLQDEAAAVIALDGLSIATSGDYRRYFDADGRRYAQTLDPRSGRPIGGSAGCRCAASVMA